MSFVKIAGNLYIYLLALILKLALLIKLLNITIQKTSIAPNHPPSFHSSTSTVTNPLTSSKAFVSTTRLSINAPVTDSVRCRMPARGSTLKTQCDNSLENIKINLVMTCAHVLQQIEIRTQFSIFNRV